MTKSWINGMNKPLTQTTYQGQVPQLLFNLLFQKLSLSWENVHRYFGDFFFFACGKILILFVFFSSLHHPLLILFAMQPQNGMCTEHPLSRSLLLFTVLLLG